MGRFLGRRQGVPSSSPQTGWPEHTQVTLVSEGGTHPHVNASCACSSWPPAARLLLHHKQESFGSKVGLELGGFHLWPALQQRCSSHSELFLVHLREVRWRQLVMNPRVYSLELALHRQREVRFPHT